MSYQQVVDGQVNPEVPINENNDALGQGFLLAHDVTADTGLVVGLTGGTLDANTVADTTVTCTDNATNYIVVHRSTRAVSVSTATTNWNNTSTYGRVARAVFASSVLTYHDERYSVGGIFDRSAAVSSVAASAVTVADGGSYYTGTDAEAVLQEIGAQLATLSGSTDADTDEVFTSDTGSTADSDPGNGIFKWNNATQASATALYVDNQTAAGVSLVTYFASLPQVGYIHLVQNDNAANWQLWKWTVTPTAGSGYYKFTSLSLMANGGSIATGKAVSVAFQGRTEGAITSAGLTMSTNKVLARSTAGTGAIEEHSLSEVLDFIGSAAQGDILYRGASAWARLAAGTAGYVLKTGGSGADPSWAAPLQCLAIACSDETTALTTGTNKVKFINPYSTAFNVTAVVASLSTAQTSGSIFTVDINEAGTSILSTKLTIDNTETNSSTAATPAVISDASLAAYAEVEVDIDQVGDGTAKGLKVYVMGYPS